MIRFLAISLMLLLFQIGAVRANESFTTNREILLCAVNASPTAASSSIPAVPLDQFLRNNGFRPNDIIQVVPVPPGQSVQTGGAASIPAVPLRDFANDNGFNPNKIRQYVPVPPAQANQPTPVCPKPQQKQTPPTGGAAPVNKTVKGYW